MRLLDRGDLDVEFLKLLQKYSGRTFSWNELYHAFEHLGRDYIAITRLVEFVNAFDVNFETGVRYWNWLNRKEGS